MNDSIKQTLSAQTVSQRFAMNTGAPPLDIHGGPSGHADDQKVRVDFSVSLNAFGPAEHVVTAIHNAPIDTYPDPTSSHVRRVASERWACPVDTIAFGAGTSELLYAAARTLLSPGDRVLVITPTFGEYERCSQLAGADIHRFWWSSEDDVLNTDTLCTTIERLCPTLVFLCTPNNPTGKVVDREALGRIANACQHTDGLLFLDQSYDAFASVPLRTPALPGHPAVVHIRSITKDHALAGIRAGFLIGPAAFIHAIELQRAPWSASTVAQAAAIATFTPESDRYLARTIPHLRLERQRIQQHCDLHSMFTIGGDTHTLLIHTRDAAVARAALLEVYGLRVRDCTSFGLSDMIRVAARTPAENDLLIAALPFLCEIAQPSAL